MATTKLFKVRDKVTGKYWNGDVRRSTFADNGKTWKKRDAVESTVGFFLRYRSRFSVQTAHSLPEHWEIVEIELVESEVGTQEMGDFLHYLLLRAEVEKVSTSMAYFLDKMRQKKVLDKIEFILQLKPSEGTRYVDMARIIEARAQIRGLGIKTRTFREGNGVFGMMDRQQALRARLSLDVEHVIDLVALRAKLGI